MVIKGKGNFTPFVSSYNSAAVSDRHHGLLFDDIPKNTTEVCGTTVCASPGGAGVIVRESVAINLQRLLVLLKRSLTFYIAMDEAVHLKY